MSSEHQAEGANAPLSAPKLWKQKALMTDLAVLNK